MANLKSLAKDTAIYGLSSIIGRFLNYLLVPLYTAKMSAESGGYGVITNMYAYVALLLVILTYGMETTFFRFANKAEEDARTVYSTTLIMVGTTSLLFVAMVFAFIGPLSRFMGYPDHPSYVWVMFTTVAIDAFQCITFAYLRYKHKALKFAALKLLFIVMNIAMNLIYYVVIGGNEVGYAFYINLVCTASITLFFYREIAEAFHRYPKTKESSEETATAEQGEERCRIVDINAARPVKRFDGKLVGRMLSYSWPILILGIAGILNQTADKILFPYVYKGGDAHSQLGIYGAASKIAMIMAMITQAFRYAYEPFVFGKSRDKDNRETYAKAMKYFIIFTLLAFLVVVGYLDILKYIIGRDYWQGLRVVPIVMAAEIMMGVYFNLSFWYKLIDKTIWGAWFSGIGCMVLIAINVMLVPRYGYMACAWAGVAGYGTAMVLSYVVGQKKYPINYPMKDIFIYVCLAAFATYWMMGWRETLPLWASLALNTMAVLFFAGVIAYYEFPQLRNKLIKK